MNRRQKQPQFRTSVTFFIRLLIIIIIIIIISNYIKVRRKASGAGLICRTIFSTPETSIHVQDKNREISPLERKRERLRGKDLEKR